MNIEGIEKYFDVNLKFNSKKESAIYETLASMNISFIKKNTFIQRKGINEKDLILTKDDVSLLFLNYLKDIDNNKMINQKIDDLFKSKNVIKQNDILKKKMPK